MQAETSSYDGIGGNGQVGYLERYFDAGIEPPNLAIKDWTDVQVERISAALAVVIIAGGIPRRLGGDASPVELALDKKRSRRVTHALRESLYPWHKKAAALPNDQETQIAGAQLDWETFIPGHLSLARNELILMATWAIHNDERRWGRSIVTRMENEIKWVTYAARD